MSSISRELLAFIGGRRDDLCAVVAVKLPSGTIVCVVIVRVFLREVHETPVVRPQKFRVPLLGWGTGYLENVP